MSARPSEREEALARKVRAAEKKLRQITELKEWCEGGKRLNESQALKLHGERALTQEIASLKAMIIEQRAAPLSNVGKDTPQLRSSNTAAPPAIQLLPASSTASAAAAACAAASTLLPTAPPFVPAAALSFAAAPSAAAPSAAPSAAAPSAAAAKVEHPSGTSVASWEEAELIMPPDGAPVPPPPGLALAALRKSARASARASRPSRASARRSTEEVDTKRRDAQAAAAASAGRAAQAAQSAREQLLDKLYNFKTGAKPAAAALSPRLGALRHLDTQMQPQTDRQPQRELGVPLQRGASHDATASSARHGEPPPLAPPVTLQRGASAPAGLAPAVAPATSAAAAAAAASAAAAAPPLPPVAAAPIRTAEEQAAVRAAVRAAFAATTPPPPAAPPGSASADHGRPATAPMQQFLPPPPAAAAAAPAPAPAPAPPRA